MIKTKAFTAIYGELPEELEPCIESQKRHYPWLEIIKRDPLETVQATRFASDILRLELAAEHNDFIWFDWDILLSPDWEHPESEKPIFVPPVRQLPTQSLVPDIYIIAHLGQQEFFKELLDARNKYDSPFWYRKHLRKNQHRVTLLGTEGYNHLAHTTKQLKGVKNG